MKINYKIRKIKLDHKGYFVGQKIQILNKQGVHKIISISEDEHWLKYGGGLPKTGVLVLDNDYLTKGNNNPRGYFAYHSDILKIEK